MIAFLIAGYTYARHCHEARNVFFFGGEERAAAGEPAARGKEAGEDGAEGSGREESKGVGREEAKDGGEGRGCGGRIATHMFTPRFFCAIIVLRNFRRRRSYEDSRPIQQQKCGVVF